MMHPELLHRLLARLAAQPCAEGDVVPCREPGQQVVALAHPGEPAGERPAVAAADLAALGPHEARDQAQQRALADAARAEQAGPPRALEREVEVAEQRRTGIADARPLHRDVEG